MNQPPNILLVEGIYDKEFYSEICKALKIEAKILVVTPKGAEKEKSESNLPYIKNTKQGVFNILKLQLDFVKQGKIKNFAVIVDADYSDKSASGFEDTLEKVSKIVKTSGYYLDENASNSGIVFKSNNGLPNFGLWIMPNNQKNGMLEDFIKQCIHADESSLMAQAVKAVQGLESPKFNPTTKTTKAEIATWLAWQKEPGHGLYNVFPNYNNKKQNLLDQDNPQFKAFTHWLGCIYNPTINHQPI